MSGERPRSRSRLSVRRCGCCRAKWFGDLKVLGKAFVKPQWHHRQVGMQQRVRTFVPHVDGQLIIQVGEHARPPVLLNEQGPAVGNLRKTFGDVLVVLPLVGH